MKTSEQILFFLKKCAESICTNSKDQKILEGAEVFTKKIESSENKPFNAQFQPVLKKINTVSSTPYTFNFHQIATKMVWNPSPRTDEKAENMALSIINNMFDLGDVVAGLLLVDSHQNYPLHQHSPQELYLILSGEAKWLYGGNEDFKKQLPGDVIYNHPYDLHGVITQNEPLLALYILWK